MQMKNRDMDKKRLLIIFGLIILFVEIVGVVLVGIDIYLRYGGESFLVYGGLIGSLLIAIGAVLYAKFYKPLTEEFPEFRGIITIVKMSQKFKKIREHLSWLFFSIFWAVIIAALLVIYFSPCNLFGGSADSARYLLSALAQSQAAIVAIVVTLTLVAVQLASQTYSPRVMDLFLKNWQFWSLLLIYGISIMYDVVLLSMIPPISANETLNVTFPILRMVLGIEVLIFVGLVLMTATFSALFLHVGYTMKKLKPKSIIKELSEEIDVKSFVEKVSKRCRGDSGDGGSREVTEDEDQVLPLVDVTKRAIRADDLATAKYGVYKLKDICKDILNGKEYKEERNDILRCFRSHLEDIGKVASYHGDERTVCEAAGALHELADIAIENGLEDENIKCVSLALYYIGNSSAERRLMDATTGVINALGGVGVSAAGKHLQATTGTAIDSLRWVGVIASKKDMMHETEASVKQLGNIGIEIVDKAKQWEGNKAFNLIENVIDIVCEMGKKAVENVWVNVIESSINVFGDIYVKAGEKRILRTGYEAPSSVITRNIWHIVEAAINKGPEFATNFVAKPLKEFCIKAINMAVNKLNGEDFDQVLINISVEIAGDIAYIGEKAIEEEDKVIKDVVGYLAEIGTEMAKAENTDYINRPTRDISLFSKDYIIQHLLDITDKILLDKKEGFLERGLISPITNFHRKIPADYAGSFLSTPSEVEPGLEVKYKWIITCLKEIGLKTSGKSLDRPSERIIKTLIEIGVLCIRDGLSKALEPEFAAKPLAELAKGTKEELFESAYKDYYESLKEFPKDRKAFEKFKKLYEEELKKQKQEKAQ